MKHPYSYHLLILFLLVHQHLDVNSIPLKKTVLMEETFYSEIKTLNNDIFKINLTLIEINSLYEVERHYSTFVPEVKIKCKENRSQEENMKYINLLTNSMTNYLIYLEESFIQRQCVSKYEVSLTNSSSRPNILALYLKYYKTFYKLRVNVENSRKTVLNTTLMISDYIKEMLLFPGMILEFPFIPQYDFLSNGWYFISKHSISSLKVNGSSFENFHSGEVNWIRQNFDRTFTKGSSNKIYNNSRIYVNNCDSSVYKCKLNVSDFYDGDLFFLSQIAENATETRKEYISHVTANLLEGNILVKEENVSKKNNFLTQAKVSLNEQEFAVTATLTVLHDSQYLVLNFTEGSGKFNVDIFIPYSLRMENFSLQIETASSIQPFIYIYKLHVKYGTTPYICVQLEHRELCQLPDVGGSKLPRMGNFKNSSLNNTSFKTTGGNNKGSYLSIVWILLAVVFFFFFIVLKEVLEHLEIGCDSLKSRRQEYQLQECGFEEASEEIVTRRFSNSRLCNIFRIQKLPLYRKIHI